ncbi:MAG TPA: PsiF family protein [Methylocella sp.]|nr:PsiF family protein [Methylocella sp.]
MKTMASLLVASALILPFGQLGYAQTTPMPTAPAAPTAPAVPSGKGITNDAEKAAKAKACSEQADAQGLHGKARKAFRAKCKAGKT